MRWNALAPALMLAALALGSPVPAYRGANESTLEDAFPGKYLDFTGELAPGGETLVRYAITCCRADAAPIVLPLDRRLGPVGGWAEVSGTLFVRRGAFALHVEHSRSVHRPSDPFIYR